MKVHQHHPHRTPFPAWLLAALFSQPGVVTIGCSSCSSTCQALWGRGKRTSGPQWCSRLSSWLTLLVLHCPCSTSIHTPYISLHGYLLFLFTNADHYWASNSPAFPHTDSLYSQRVNSSALPQSLAKKFLQVNTPSYGTISGIWRQCPSLRSSSHSPLAVSPS